MLRCDAIVRWPNLAQAGNAQAWLLLEEHATAGAPCSRSLAAAAAQNQNPWASARVVWQLSRYFPAKAAPRVSSSQLVNAISTIAGTSSFKTYPSWASFVAASVTSA